MLYNGFLPYAKYLTKLYTVLPTYPLENLLIFLHFLLTHMVFNSINIEINHKWEWCLFLTQ